MYSELATSLGNCHITDDPPGPFKAIFAATDGPSGPSMAAIESLWSLNWLHFRFSVNVEGV